jgi:hypothetical protein
MLRTALVSLAFIAIGSLAHAQGRGEVSPTWTLVEDLRIGEDDGPKSFSDIRSVVATRNGNIFVLDYKTRDVRLFDGRGNFVKQVSRSGAGPGEIRDATGMAVSPKDVVWVRDPANSRFSLFSSDGSFIKQVLVNITSRGFTWDGPIDASGRAVDRISVNVRQVTAGLVTGDTKFRLIDDAGRADTIDAPSCPGRTPPPEPNRFEFRNSGGAMFMSIPFLPRGQIVYTQGGTAWCTASAEYSLWAGPVGQPVREVVKLDVAPPPVTTAERQKELDRIDSLKKAFGSMPVGDVSLIPRTKPVIDRIHGDPLGRVWVRMSSATEATPSFDVFDANGRAAARVASRGKVDPVLTWITGSHVYTVLKNDDDVPTVVRYRIVR